MGRTRSYRVIPTNEFLALINANSPSAVNPYATIADIASGSVNITVVANYSALPAANTVTGEFYYCENSQGTAWLPGSLGGTYYPKGLYYSNGVSWIVTDAPYQASQAEVGTEAGDGGVVTDKFITPETLNGKGYSTLMIKSGEIIPSHRVIVVPNISNSGWLFDPTNNSHYGKVIGISYNSVNSNENLKVITDDKITIGPGLYTSGSVLYASTNGVLTETPPLTGIIQSVGIYWNSVLHIHIGTPILKA